ncbi:XrtN system VIT domain-containing protein [Emticicia sp. 17c]|uniref:XrtN system VIT domain-containing protein n=1 Tax=Emticicia sp. 17c TaxID=3127704 RepID=UPI00301E2050
MNTVDYISEKKIHSNSLHWKNLNVSGTYILGLVSLLICLAFFHFSEKWQNQDILPSLLTQMISIFYVVVLLYDSRMRVFWKKQPSEQLSYRLLAWQIWVVSCFTLNRSVGIFQESTDWLSVALCLSAAANILFHFNNLLPKFFQEILFTMLGASTVLWFYFTAHTLWLYPFSFLGIIILGLSFHTFIPLLLLIAHVKLLIKYWHSYKPAFLFGLITPFVLTIVFISQWIFIQEKIRTIYQESFTSKTAEIPTWLAVAEKVENTWITEKILKSDLVYTTFKGNFDVFTLTNNFEKRLHDPLVLLASFFYKDVIISYEEKMKILNMLQDIRHESQIRLRSGTHLQTSAVITQARIYPEYRIAYTEKNLTIVAPFTFGQSEAIYTFYLPEGSVVSSLSLWVNGKEEKAYLTTKSKAQNAYNTIVGRESRDPSVVYWQEGNSISVRVFPCSNTNPRHFKIGFTSPLKEKNGRLIYENIYFKGPDAQNADEIVKINFTSKIDELSAPWSSNDNNAIEHKGSYTPYWQLSFNTPELSKKAFSFDGKSYVLEKLNRPKINFNPDKVFLDINKEWSRTEFNDVCETFKNKEIWVWNNALVKLNESNRYKLFKELKQNQFSLFPLYQIPDPTRSLFITKGNYQGPILEDLKDSNFAKAIRNMNTSNGAIQTICLNDELSPYLKTLKEMSVIMVDWQDIDQLKNKKIFYIKANKAPVVSIETAGMQIREDSTSNAGKTDAPDHLLRLYAYNDIMQQIGVKYFQQDFLTPKLIDEAAKANIVTPVSSLIVLETQDDYNRFEIKKTDIALANASLNASGSVPEPHEWVLIIALGVIIVFFVLKKPC